MKIADLNQLNLDTSLPSPKGVALALLELCKQEDVTIGEITKLIQTDPALSGRLVQRANAAKITTRSISSVAEAVSRVGLSAVKQLAMGFSLIDQYRQGPSTGFDYQAFWSHSLLMAIAMQELGKVARAAPPDELFSCGLLMRIGRMALATVYPEKYTEILKEQPSDIDLSRLEQIHLHTDHNELTAALLVNFGFPPIFIECIYYHEDPDASSFSDGSRPYQIVQLLHLGKQIADFALSGDSVRNQKIAGLLFLGGKIGLDTKAFGTFIDQIIREWHAWGKILKIPVVSLSQPFEKMITAAAPRVDQEDNAHLLRILLVEDDVTSAILTQEILANTLGHTVVVCGNGQEALTQAVDFLPNIVITDWMMPVMSGLELVKSLRATEWGQHLYVIMLTGVENEDEVIKAFDAGVDDYISKPINIRAFRARLRAAWHYCQLQESWERDREQLKRFAAELAVTNRKLEYYALTDMLTELPNRRSGIAALEGTWSVANRSGQLMAIMLLDIDYFKKINDVYGHAIGDKVLKEVAAIFRKAGRKGDMFCRLGGEEFLVVCQLGTANASAVVHFAERLRHLISQQKIDVGEEHIQITISIGVAIKESSIGNTDQLINAADKALYAAKHAGRNRIFIAYNKKIIAAPSNSGHSSPEA
ncbi:MAG: diguanylate cyclase [Nitrosomonas sp.]|nr:MAG: diguanylate cyclase [Nitrosomonas sp.]